MPDQGSCRHKSNQSRRSFLRLAVGAGLSIIAAPHVARAGVEAKRIALYNIHTGEAVKTVFWESGRFVPGALNEIDFLLRDYRTDQVTHMDPRLIDLLWRVHRIAEARQPFTVVSGYRSPQTNEKLRKAGQGVAKHSLHMVGQAVDVQLPGVPLRKLHRIAKAQKAGGVGYYGKSGFIHIDTGPIRYW